MIKKSTYTTLGTQTANRWHSVAVVGGPAPCPAALAARQKRFLSADAPRLPLPDCTSPARCQCRYQHYTDRRATKRRSEDRGGLPHPFTGDEKRKPPQGRRKSDLE
jgi:hypothetical protein